MNFRSSHIGGFLVAGLVATGLTSAWAIVTVRNLQWRSAQEHDVELLASHFAATAPAITNLVRAALISPVIVSIGLLGIFGASLIAMMSSVRSADNILRKTPDSERVVSLAELVPWLQVRTMLKRALATTGPNLHYFQAIIEKAEHDVLGELRCAQEPQDNPDAKFSTIASILRKLVLDSRMSTRGDRNILPLEAIVISMENLVIHFHHQGLKAVLVSEEQKSLTLRLRDDDAIRRLVLNLSSNVSKHGKGQFSKCTLLFENESLCVRIQNSVSFWKWVFLDFAARTGGIDTANADVPLVRKWMGREGVGFRIIKKAVVALGGTLNVNIMPREFLIVVHLPANRIDEQVSNRRRRRVAGFVNLDLEEVARKAGLGNSLVSADVVRDMVSRREVDEVMVDFALPEAPDEVIVRSVKTGKRVQGVVKLWQGETT